MLIPGGQYRCVKHAQQDVEDRARSRNKKRGQSPYNTNEWWRARAAFLLENPYCAECYKRGRVAIAATVVDHVVPHKGDTRLFWDRRNWQGLCSRCHGRKTASEDGGFGNPVLRRAKEGDDRDDAAVIGF